MLIGGLSNRVGVAATSGFLQGSHTYSFESHPAAFQTSASLISGWSVAAIRSYTHTPTAFGATATASYNAVLAKQSNRHWASAFAGTSAMQTFSGVTTIQSMTMPVSALAGSGSLGAWSKIQGLSYSASMWEASASMPTYTRVGQGQKIAVTALQGTAELQTYANVELAPRYSISSHRATARLGTTTVVAQRVAEHAGSIFAGSAGFGTHIGKVTSVVAASQWAATASANTATESAVRSARFTPLSMRAFAASYAVSVTASAITAAPVLSATFAATALSGFASATSPGVSSKVSASETFLAWESVASTPTATLKMERVFAASALVATMRLPRPVVASSAIVTVGPSLNGYHLASAFEAGASLSTANPSYGFTYLVPLNNMRVLSGMPTHSQAITELDGHTETPVAMMGGAEMLPSTAKIGYTHVATLWTATARVPTASYSVAAGGPL